MTNQIADVQTYLSKLRGRTDARAYGHHPDQYEDSEAPFTISLAIRLHRSDKDWILSYGTASDANPEDEPSWEPLLNAPLEIKMAAVDIFPDLMAGIESSQSELVEKVAKAINKLQTFSSALKIQPTAVGGKDA